MVLSSAPSVVYSSCISTYFIPNFSKTRNTYQLTQDTEHTKDKWRVESEAIAWSASTDKKKEKAADNEILLILYSWPLNILRYMYIKSFTHSLVYILSSSNNVLFRVLSHLPLSNSIL